MGGRGLIAAALGLLAGAASAAGPAKTVHVDLVCDAVYLPARSNWVRTVRITFDDQRVRAVTIDGQSVYTFNVQGTTLLTALDNERIRIDTATLSWHSDFRGLATAEGRCERLD